MLAFEERIVLVVVDHSIPVRFRPKEIVRVESHDMTSLGSRVRMIGHNPGQKDPSQNS